MCISVCCCCCFAILLFALALVTFNVFFSFVFFCLLFWLLLFFHSYTDADVWFEISSFCFPFGFHSVLPVCFVYIWMLMSCMRGLCRICLPLCVRVYWWDRVNLIAKIVRLARTIHIKLGCWDLSWFQSAFRMDFLGDLSLSLVFVCVVHVFVCVSLSCHVTFWYFSSVSRLRIVAYLVFSLKIYFSQFSDF